MSQGSWGRPRRSRIDTVDVVLGLEHLGPRHRSRPDIVTRYNIIHFIYARFVTFTYKYSEYIQIQVVLQFASLREHRHSVAGHRDVTLT